MSSILKKSLVASCYAFTSLTVLYALLMVCIYDASEGIYMSAVTVFFFFPLAYFISLATFIVKDTKIKGGLKLFSHFTIVTLSIILFIFVPHGGGMSGQNAFILFVVYTLLYAIGASIFGFIKSRKKTSNEKKSDYKNVY